MFPIASSSISSTETQHINCGTPILVDQEGNLSPEKPDQELDQTDHEDKDDENDQPRNPLTGEDEPKRTSSLLVIQLKEETARFGQQRRQQILRDFVHFSVVCSVVPSTAVACLALSAGRWGIELGAQQCGVLYMAYTASALTGLTVLVMQPSHIPSSPLAVSSLPSHDDAIISASSSSLGGRGGLSSRNSIILGMALALAYMLSFFFSAGRKPETEMLHPDSPSPGSRIVALTGAAFGGLGLGLLWTAQGVYFSQAAQAHTAAGAVPSPEGIITRSDAAAALSRSTSLLGGIFAGIFLFQETILELLATLWIRTLHLSWFLLFALYTTLAILATVAMFWVRAYPSTATPIDAQSPEEPCNSSSSSSLTFGTRRGVWESSKMMAAIRLLIRDPKMKYMIGLNASFALAGAFLNSFVSGQVVPVALSDAQSSYVGLLVAIQGGVAALTSVVFGAAAQHWGKIPILMLGLMCLACVAGPFILQPDLTQWTWGLLILVYAMQGIGRATFEGTVKGIFADYFVNDKEAAFANIILQNGLTSSLAYMLSFRLTSCRADSSSPHCIPYQDGTSHNVYIWAGTVVGLCLTSMLGLWRASCLRQGEMGEPNGCGDWTCRRSDFRPRPSLRELLSRRGKPPAPLPTQARHEKESSSVLKRTAYQAVDVEAGVVWRAADETHSPTSTHQELV